MSGVIDERDTVIAPLPRISIQVFAETNDVADSIQHACQDRRMSKAHVKVQTGGVAAAVEAYRNATTPNVIIVESRLNAMHLLAHLDELAGFCDEGTRVVVIGHTNDVLLYRELLRRGVSDYLIAPIQPLDIVRSLSDLFGQAGAGAAPVGKTVAVYGARGGVGSSTVAHNLGHTIVRDTDLATLIVDFDLPFGTAGLDFNQDPLSGIFEAIAEPDRVDAVMIDRLITACGEKLSILAAPSTLDRTYDHSYRNFEPVIDLLRNVAPYIVYDMPHMWTDWARKVLLSADEIVIVAEPDLANLRNAKNLVDALRAARKNDAAPHLVLNQVGMPKRPEIEAGEFAAALELTPVAVIPFDANLFGTAANNGQMLSEVQARHKAAEEFSPLAQAVTGKMDKSPRRKASPLASLEPLLAKLKMKKAG